LRQAPKRAKCRARIEGKVYVTQGGDVLEFGFDD